jgi:hypothetical protein
MIGGLLNFITEYVPGFTWARTEERFISESGLRDLLGELVRKGTGVVPSLVSASSVGIVINSSGNTRCVLLPLPMPQIRLSDVSSDGTELWITDTMRSIWFEIISEVQYARGVFDYKPAYPIFKSLMLFAGGVAIGAGMYQFSGPRALFGRLATAVEQAGLENIGKKSTPGSSSTTPAAGSFMSSVGSFLSPTYWIGRMSAK